MASATTTPPSSCPSHRPRSTSITNSFRTTVTNIALKTKKAGQNSRLFLLQKDHLCPFSTTPKYPSFYPFPHHLPSLGNFFQAWDKNPYSPSGAQLIKQLYFNYNHLKSNNIN